MHDFTARILHEDRMAELHREADAYRMARQARAGSQRTGSGNLRGGRDGSSVWSVLSSYES